MTAHIQRNYKNGLFLMIFGNKPALLSLYNAIRGSNYTNPDDLIINTVEGVLYLGMKNDVSFIINNELNLYEAQASWNPCHFADSSIFPGSTKAMLQSMN